MNPLRFYTAQEVASIWKVSRSLVYALMKRGELATVRIGHLPRVTEQGMNDYVERQAQNALDASEAAAQRQGR